MPIIITILILIYFIYQQLEYERIRRITYVAIPIVKAELVRKKEPD